MVPFSTRLKTTNSKALRRFVKEKGVKLEHVVNQAIEEFLARQQASKRAA